MAKKQKVGIFDVEVIKEDEVVQAKRSRGRRSMFEPLLDPLAKLKDDEVLKLEMQKGRGSALRSYLRRVFGTEEEEQEDRYAVTTRALDEDTRQVYISKNPAYKG